MTTIATNGVSVAADGRIVIGTSVFTQSARKIFRIHGEIVGTSGDFSFGDEYLTWTRQKFCKRLKPKLPPKRAADFFRALHISKKDVILVDADMTFLRAIPPIAIGSGADYALAAMLQGATPAEAVAIAAKMDPWTGGNITEMHL